MRNKSPKNMFTKGEPLMLALNSPFPAFPILSINLKGRGKQTNVLVDNHFINFGNIYIGERTSKAFLIKNDKVGLVNIKLDKQMEVLHLKRENYKFVNNYFKEFPKDSRFTKKQISYNYIPKKQETENIVVSSGNIFSNLIKQASNEIYTTNNSNYNYVKYLTVVTSMKNIVYDAEEKVLNQLSPKKKNKATIQNSITNSSKFFKTNKLMLKSKLSSLNSSTAEEYVVVDNSKTIKVPKDLEVNITIEFLPEKLGMYKSTLLFYVVDGIPFSIDVYANIIGPQIKLETPALDFGIFSVGVIKQLPFRIINTSKIKAKFLVKQSKYKNVSFDNHKELNFIEETEGLVTIEPNDRKPISNIQEFNSRHLNYLDLAKSNAYKIKFSKVLYELEPFESKEITVKLLLYS